MNFYINVLRVENFEVDFNKRFNTLAIAERKTKLSKKLLKGDQIISYVSSRISSFAVIRTVVDPTLIPSSTLLEYDVPILGYIKTEPNLILEKSEWVKVTDMIENLTFIKHKKYWMNKFLNSLFEISKEDFELIRMQMSNSYKCKK